MWTGAGYRFSMYYNSEFMNKENLGCCLCFRWCLLCSVLLRMDPWTVLRSYELHSGPSVYKNETSEQDRQ